MRSVAIGLLVALCAGMIPAMLPASNRPNCCRDERICPMHRAQGSGCRMGACHDNSTAVPVPPMISTERLASIPQFVAIEVLQIVAERTRGECPQPSIPPPRS